MCVQYRHRTGAALQLSVVLAEAAQRPPGAIHQGRVKHTLMLPNQGAQLSRHSERDQKVAARHQGLRLALNPALALKVLAVRTIALPTGMRHHALLGAVATAGQHAWAQV